MDGQTNRLEDRLEDTGGWTDKWKDRNRQVATGHLLNQSLEPHRAEEPATPTPDPLPSPIPCLFPSPGSQGGQHLFGLMPRDAFPAKYKPRCGFTSRCSHLSRCA